MAASNTTSHAYAKAWASNDLGRGSALFSPQMRRLLRRGVVLFASMEWNLGLFARGEHAGSLRQTRRTRGARQAREPSKTRRVMARQDKA